MRYILGIDQGGTKTAVAIMREDGVIVGTAVAKGAYYPKHGIASALDRVEEAVEVAGKQAGIDRKDIIITVAGITGVDFPGDDKIVKDEMGKRLACGEITVCNDALIALYTVTGFSHGMLICAGTGMNGAIIDESGRQFVYGDYMEESMQGGSALARRALRKVFDAEMGLCGDTLLTGLFLKHAGVSTVDELLRMYMTKPEFVKGIKFLVPQILELAGKGDEETCRMTDAFAEQIVAYIFAGFGKMEMNPAREKIVLAGNVFKGKDNYLTGQIIGRIKEREPEVAVVMAEYEPVVGACVMGLNLLDIGGEEVERNIAMSAKEKGLFFTDKE